MIDSELKLTLGISAGVLCAIVLGFVLCYGPAGLKTGLSGWYASSYGSDWLVVQYAQSGCRIAQWELEEESIQNEGGSDGIYFVAEDGSVVHLSGHYTYVQYPTDEIKAELTRTPRCSEEE